MPALEPPEGSACSTQLNVHPLLIHRRSKLSASLPAEPPRSPEPSKAPKIIRNLPSAICKRCSFRHKMSSLASPPVDVPLTYLVRLILPRRLEPTASGCLVTRIPT